MLTQKCTTSPFTGWFYVVISLALFRKVLVASHEARGSGGDGEKGREGRHNPTHLSDMPMTRSLVLTDETEFRSMVSGCSE